MAGSHEDGTQRGPDVERRTILRAAAWTVPTIVVATASPAAANASGTMVATAASAVLVGPKTVEFTVTFGGTSPGPHTVSFNRLGSQGSTWVSLNGLLKVIPDGGGTVTFRGSVFLGKNPPGASVTINYSVHGHGGPNTIVAVVPV